MHYRILTKIVSLTILTLSLSLSILSINTFAQTVVNPQTPDAGNPGIPGATTTTAQPVDVTAPATPTLNQVGIQLTAAAFVNPTTTQAQATTPVVTTQATPAATTTLTTQDFTKTVVQSDTVRTGAVSIFILLAIPVAVMLYYQFKFYRSKKNVLATQEQKIQISK
jgi:hypothetical protein